MRKSTSFPLTRGRAKSGFADSVKNPIIIDNARSPEEDWLNMELVRFTENCCERDGDFKELEPDHYERMIALEDSEMRSLTKAVILSRWAGIQKIIDSPKGDDDQVYGLIQTVLYLVLRGNFGFDSDLILRTTKPIGAELTYDVQRRMIDRVVGDRRLQKEVFIDLVKRGHEREKKKQQSQG